MEILWQYSNHMWWFKIPSIKKPGMKIIRKNELSIICNLNIKYLIWNQHISITGPKEMSNFHHIYQQYNGLLKKLALYHIKCLISKANNAKKVKFMESSNQWCSKTKD